jgi:uncharacterized protein YecT (DUF1311 family)
MRSILFLLLTCFVCLRGFSQTPQTLDSLEQAYQKRLDTGIDMYGETYHFYVQTDSMLNLVYNKLRKSCDSLQKENLRDEQLVWLKERDAEFWEHLKKFKTRNPEAEPGQPGSLDDAMIMYESYAHVVLQRVYELLKKQKSDYSPANYSVSSTGYFELESTVVRKDGETWGRFGDIRVKRLTGNKLVLRLFVCRGAMGYHMGIITDTLEVKDNKAVYSTTEFDPSCRVVFRFYKRGIVVIHSADDYNNSCGFGQGVLADGFYKLKSAAVPSDRELTED